MRSKIRTAKHYLDVFRQAVAADGWRYAIRRSTIFMKKRSSSASRKAVSVVAPSVLTTELAGPTSPYESVIETLPIPRARRNLLLIVSDSKIRQCVHFRIQQKLRYLDRIGVKAMHLSPVDMGRVKSFMGLAHSVIIYRTALPKDVVQSFRDYGAKVYFEFDDLVVGSRVLEASGILDQVTEHQARGLSKLSDEFLDTAQRCDGIIVSTPVLAEIYGKPENGLAFLPRHVVPNFVETDSFPAPGEKSVTFAYTSPSGSIRRELSMLSDFLSAYDRAAAAPWSILVMGNPVAQKSLAAMTFAKGTVKAQPFSDFDAYLQTIGAAETVLIPLSDSTFNRSKTAIRLMDAALAGSQAVFCPVGAYDSIRKRLRDDSLCIPVDGWGEAGENLLAKLNGLDDNVRDLQQAVRKECGVDTALACYRNVFLNRLGLSSNESLDLSIAS